MEQHASTQPPKQRTIDPLTMKRRRIRWVRRPDPFAAAETELTGAGFTFEVVTAATNGRTGWPTAA